MKHVYRVLKGIWKDRGERKTWLGGEGFQETMWPHPKASRERERERERETALQRDPKAKTKKVTYGDLEGRWWTRDWDGKVNGAPKRLSLKKGFTRDTGRWPRVSGETVAG